MGENRRGFGLKFMKKSKLKKILNRKKTQIRGESTALGHFSVSIFMGK